MNELFDSVKVVSPAWISLYNCPKELHHSHVAAPPGWAIRCYPCREIQARSFLSS
jgi:hypothetical protein